MPKLPRRDLPRGVRLVRPPLPLGFGVGIQTHRGTGLPAFLKVLASAQAANEIVEVIFEALMIPAAESSIEKKLARIYLVRSPCKISICPTKNGRGRHSRPAAAAAALLAARLLVSVLCFLLPRAAPLHTPPWCQVSDILHNSSASVPKARCPLLAARRASRAFRARLAHSCCPRPAPPCAACAHTAPRAHSPRALKN